MWFLLLIPCVLAVVSLLAWLAYLRWIARILDAHGPAALKQARKAARSWPSPIRGHGRLRLRPPKNAELPSRASRPRAAGASDYRRLVLDEGKSSD